MRKFKKLVSILVAVMVLISTLSVSLVIADKMIDNSTYKDLEIYDTTEFKDLEVVDKEVKVGVISDTHISQYFLDSKNEFNGDTVNKLKLALNFYKRQQIDLLLLTGDIVDLAEEADYALLVKTFEEVYGSKENAPEIVYTFGNHEFAIFKRDEDGNPITTTGLGFAESFSRHKQYIQPWVDYEIWNGQSGTSSVGERIQLIENNGVYVINYCESTTFTAEDLNRVDALLAEATSKTDKPVLVSFHYEFGSDLYGANLPLWADNSTYERKLTAVFEKYPQAVLLMGHQHASPLHGRAISQSLGYTSLISGASNTIAVCDTITGVTDITDDTSPRYENYYSSTESILGVDGETIIQRHNIGYKGLLLTFADGKMTSNVVDFEKNIIIDDVNVFEVPYGINLDNKDEKFNYTIDKMKAEQGELTFETNAKVSLSVKNEQLVISFPSVKEFNACEGYKIEISKNGSVERTIYWQSNFIFYPSEIETYSVMVSDITAVDGYSVLVSPIDFFGRISSGITNN